ncbi:hypothetical protein [uncultured Bradyrhizobium sp.]|uniref:hypothetical protein n=1 Tax=uncultured Bradyrhizobium sp. TaxID=199684 RepID=UPI00260B959B|nr:hypothetical protein [uncultured Bradyrhizobium sp.]
MRKSGRTVAVAAVDPSSPLSGGAPTPALLRKRERGKRRNFHPNKGIGSCGDLR